MDLVIDPSANELFPYTRLLTCRQTVHGGTGADLSGKLVNQAQIFTAVLSRLPGVLE